MADERPLEFIRIKKDGLFVGGRSRQAGEVLPVSLVGEPGAQHLIETRRAERASETAARQAGVAEEG